MAFAPSFSPSDFAPPGFGAPNYPPLGEIKNDLKSWHALKSRQRDIFELMEMEVPGSESCLRDRACEISLRIHQLEHGLMGIDTPYTITALARAEQSIKELSNKLTQGVEQITKVEERIAAIEERLTTMDILQRQDRARNWNRSSRCGKFFPFMEVPFNDGSLPSSASPCCAVRIRNIQDINDLTQEHLVALLEGWGIDYPQLSPRECRLKVFELVGVMWTG